VGGELVSVEETGSAKRQEIVEETSISGEIFSRRRILKEERCPTYSESQAYRSKLGKKKRTRQERAQQCGRKLRGTNGMGHTGIGVGCRIFVLSGCEGGDAFNGSCGGRIAVGKSATAEGFSQRTKKDGAEALRERTRSFQYRML